MPAVALRPAGAVPVAQAIPAEPSMQVFAAEAGNGRATAIVAGGVAEEYAYLRARSLTAESRSLIVDGKRACDMLRARDVRDALRELWFDISRCYGKGGF